MSETISPPIAATGPSGPRASFGRRLVAFLIDALLITLVELALIAVTNRSLGQLLGIAIAFAYFGFFEGSPSGQTIGKRALGIRVIDFTAGGPIGFGRGLLRYLARILSTIACFLGYFWMLWDREKQCWHDKIATTVVVPVAFYPVAKWPG